METKDIIVKEVNPLVEEATSITVATEADIVIAKEFCAKSKELKDHIEETYHPTENKKKAYKLYKDLNDTEKAIYGPIEHAEAIVKVKARDYETKKAMAAKKAAERLESIRRDKEEKERKKLEARAEKQIDKGNIEQAEQLMEEAEVVSVLPAPAPIIETKKLIRKAKVANMFMLCKSISEGSVPFSVVEVKVSALSAFAKNHDGSSIPGLTFYEETGARI